jgi:tRNA pseudouridine38-40 synthase
MPRYRMTIAYDGAAFHGWQIQRPPDGPPLRTVQGVISDAVTRVVHAPIIVQGASRTDAGVHAKGQTAHFDADDMRVPEDRLAMAINARLDGDVEILDARVTRDDFESISDALSKQYRYRFWIGDRRPLHRRNEVYICRHDLDVDAMHQAAQLLIGERDFEAFASASHNRLSTVRTIHGATVEACEVDQSPEVHFTVSGNGFLYNMVRICAGTLLEIGRGHWPVDRVTEILQSKDRSLAGPTIPGTGLCLEWIKYPEEGTEAQSD